MSSELQTPNTRSGVATLLFTDIAGSTALKQRLGDRTGLQLIQRHHELLRQVLAEFPGAREINTAGDSFFLVFPMPSAAVSFAVRLQTRLRDSNLHNASPIHDRVGIHLGEVAIEGGEQGVDVHGLSVDMCARVMSLAQAGQVLMTRPVFDNARQLLKGEEIAGVSGLEWLNHGRFELKGIEEPIEICEVRAAGATNLSPPTASEKARRVEAAEGEAVLGWRPAVGQMVPNTKWVLQGKLGEGGFGEVWLGQHQVMKERRVFKFCFRADRVRSLKREMTLFRLIKERIGDHPNIVSLREVYFDQPPFYVEEDYVAGQDLASWCAAQGGPDKVPLETKLEIVAQIADALQAAHDAGVIHRDVKPGNILVASSEAGRVVPSTPPGPEGISCPSGSLGRASPTLNAKLTDFGVGQVISEEALAGVTKAGFTQTMLSSGSSQTGTHLYMAPELLEGKPASTRSDIFSLGVVLYQLLLSDLRRSLTTDWVRQINDPLLRDDLEHCFAGDPDTRFAGAAQLALNLRTWKSRKAELARRQAEQAERESLRRQAEHRRRAFRATGLLTAVLVLVALALGYGLWRARAERASAEANAYASDMSVAQQALLADDLGKARALLARYRSGSRLEQLRGLEWRYLAAEARNEYAAVDTSSADSVLRLDMSADGRLLAVGRRYRGIELWDPGSLKRIATLETNVGGAVAFSPDGKLLAASAPGGGIRLWQLEPRRIIGELISAGSIKRLCFSPDGRHLASFQGREVCVWDLENQQAGKRCLEFPFRTYHEGPICFSPNGSTLAVGDGSGRIHILNWADNQILINIPAHNQVVTSLAYSPDGRLLASGSGYSAEEIRLWNPITGETAGSLPGHRAWIPVLQFSADGRQLLSGSADQTIGVWDVQARSLIRKLHGHSDEVWSLALDERRTNLISGCKDGTLMRWEISPAKSHALRSDVTEPAWRPGYCTDRGIVALIHRPGAVALWRPGEGVQPAAITFLGTNNSSLATAPGHGLVACAPRDGPVHIWSVSSAKLLTNLVEHTGVIQNLGFSKGDTFLLASDWSGLITIWNAKTWAKCVSLTKTNGLNGLFGAALSPDGRVLVLGLWDGRLEWWDAVRSCRMAETTGHRQPVGGLDFSPDGDTVVSASEDGTVALWDARTRRQTAHWKGHFLGLHSVAFSPDGTRLAAGLSGGSAVRIWDLRTQRELLTLVAPGNFFLWCKFSPDGDALLCGSEDGHCYQWRVPSLAEVDGAL